VVLTLSEPGLYQTQAGGEPLSLTLDLGSDRQGPYSKTPADCTLIRPLNTYIGCLSVTPATRPTLPPALLPVGVIPDGLTA
jgi:hypothetical protein